ncbi:MAG: hypothetical protein AVDCRST_MAG70-2357, partial [uncultured Thermomicrobiales bacterium]
VPTCRRGLPSSPRATAAPRPDRRCSRLHRRLPEQRDDGGEWFPAAGDRPD